MTHNDVRLGELIFTYCDPKGRSCQRKHNVYNNHQKNDVCVEIGSTRYFVTDVNIHRVELIARSAYKSAEEQKLEQSALVTNVLHNPKPESADIANALSVLASIHQTKFSPSTMRRYNRLEIASNVTPFLHNYVNMEYVLSENHVFEFGPQDSTCTQIYDCDDLEHKADCP